jgi:hypothetical protein
MADMKHSIRVQKQTGSIVTTQNELLDVGRGVWTKPSFGGGVGHRSGL